MLTIEPPLCLHLQQLLFHHCVNCHGQGTLLKREFIWTYSFLMAIGTAVSSGHSSWQRRQEHIAKQRNDFLLSKSPIQVTYFLSKATPPKPPQTAPPTGGQVFKCRDYLTFSIQTALSRHSALTMPVCLPVPPLLHVQTGSKRDTRVLRVGN